MLANYSSKPAARSATRSFVRHVLASALVGAIGFVGAVNTVSAQASQSGFELRPFVGGYVPTGDQRDFLKDAVLVGAQGSWRLLPALALTGTLSWSPTKDRLTAGEETLDVVQYDIGAEARAASWLGAGTWDFTPFVGLGVGGRTYSYRDLDVESKTNVATYGALGGDLYFGRVGLRIEARDYLSRFKPLIGTGETETRNDISIVTALTFRF